MSQETQYIPEFEPIEIPEPREIELSLTLTDHEIAAVLHALDRAIEDDASRAERMGGEEVADGMVPGTSTRMQATKTAFDGLAKALDITDEVGTRADA